MLSKAANSFNVKTAQKKILFAVSSINNLGYAASSEGVLKVLNGIKDSESEPFQALSCFGCLISLNGKKVKSHVRVLVHHGYLRQTYRDGEYYLSTTQKAAEIVNKMEGTSFKKHERVVQHIPAFIKINKE